MEYIGLDYHLRQSDLCVLDERGTVRERFRVHGGWETVVKGRVAQP
jgi:hypothetical protein